MINRRIVKFNEWKYYVTVLGSGLIVRQIALRVAVLSLRSHLVLNVAEGNGGNDVADRQDEKLRVEPSDGAVTEAYRRGDRLAEFEHSERRCALLHEHRAQQRVDLSVEAGVAEAEGKAAGHRQDRRRSDVRWAVGVGERRVVRQIEENGNEGEQVDAEPGDHHRPDAADAGHLGAADTEDGAADHLADPDEDPGKADQALANIAQRFGESDTGRVDA